MQLLKNPKPKSTQRLPIRTINQLPTLSPAPTVTPSPSPTPSPG